MPASELPALLAACRANPAPLSDWEARFLADLAARGREPTPKQRATLDRIAARAPVDFADLAARLTHRAGDLARVLTGAEPTHQSREEWRFRARGSLAVVVAGADRGSWFDHEAGAGGDALALVAHLRRQAPRDAAEWALAWLGDAGHQRQPAALPQSVAPPPARREARDTTPTARRLWGEAAPAAGTLAEIYLAWRGLKIEPGAPIRFHPACPRGWDAGRRAPVERLPAMLALMTDPATGEPCGVHRTFLAPDGRGKAPPGPNGELAKMMAGRAGVIRLVPDVDVTAGLGIAEGVETALAVMQRTGWRPVWAATSAGAIRIFPVLSGIEALTVFADADGPGMDAARACCLRWAEAGREARSVAPPVGDWDDALPARELAA